MNQHPLAMLRRPAMLLAAVTIAASCGNDAGTSASSAPVTVSAGVEASGVTSTSGSGSPADSAGSAPMPTLTRTATGNESDPPLLTYPGQVTSTTIPPTTTTTAPPPTTALPTTTVPPATAPPTTVTFVFHADVLFETNVGDLTDDGRLALSTALADHHAQLIAARGITIEGFADDRGSATANDVLSQQRADATAAYMAQMAPELQGRMQTFGRGAAGPDPTCTGDCPQNRIVRITVES